MLVSYHDPTGVVNIAQILNLLETSIAQNILEQLDTSSLQEIRGSPQREGYYIHRSAAREILKEFFLPKKAYSWDENKQCRPKLEFFGGDHTTSISTEEMIGLIHFNGHDEKVTWGHQTLTVEDAMKECEDHGLFVARDTLLRVASNSSDRKLYYSDEDIMKLFDQSDESDYPTEATSHASFQSQDSLRFTPKKKKMKTRSNVPTLPAQWKVPVKEEVKPKPAEKVREWVGPDIRKTRFTNSMSSKKGGESSRRR